MDIMNFDIFEYFGWKGLDFGFDNCWSTVMDLDTAGWYIPILSLDYLLYIY